MPLPKEKGQHTAMSQVWQDRRNRQASLLKARSQRTGAEGDYLVWERYTRKTVQMETVAAALNTGLDGRWYRAAHGLSVRHRGRTSYLEHVVTGPAGIYLLETLDPSSFDWQKDLVQNIELFRSILGPNAHRFVCLVIQREPMRGQLPPGAHLVDSVDVALQVITASGEPMEPLVADEVWRTLYALDAGQSEAPERPSIFRRAGWLGLTNVIIAGVVCAIMSAAIYEPGPLWKQFIGILVAIFMLVVPVALLTWLVQYIPWDWLRKSLMWVIFALEVLLLIIATVGYLVDLGGHL
jgi:hypothetical protein